MVDRYTRERIENWAADFSHGDRAREFATATIEFAPQILTQLLCSAVDAGDSDLEQLTEADLRSALLGDVARLELPLSARRETPNLCAAFLSELEREGRLSNGHSHGNFLRALAGAFEAAGGAQKPFVRPGSALSRNDACPCGSGKKYKKCCQRLLDK